MKNQLTKHDDNPAIDAGQTHHGDAGCGVSTVMKRALGFALCYGYTSQAVVTTLAGGDAALGIAVTEQMKAEGLIRTVQCNQQRSGEVLKLTPRGLDYAVAGLGLPCFVKYDTTARLRRPSFVRHDLSSQLYLAEIVRRQDIVGYMPEASLPPSRKAKNFDLVIVPEQDRVVGVEIERTPKYEVELAETLERAALAIRKKQVDQVIFVLPTAFAAARYRGLRDELARYANWERCRTYREEDGSELYDDECIEPDSDFCIARAEDEFLEWDGEGCSDLSGDDFMGIDFIVGNPVIWRGAL